MASSVSCVHSIPLPDGAEPAVFAAVRQDSYRVHVTASEPDAVARLVEEIDGRRVALVTDDVVAGLHGDRLVGRLRGAGLRVDTTTFPAGEGSKNLDTAWSLLDWLAASSIQRRDVVVALGGGVVIDTVGWVASAYMRGVPYINVPTTLLGAVDAALGGKVAVDHWCAKNLIGAFYQPKAVVSHVGFLGTLDRRQLAAGLAEVIKKGVIGSPGLFELIERSVDDVLAGDAVALERVVAAASVVKCALIAADPYEEDLRRPLNLGHTVGHAVETVTGYGPVLHGEAVAYGMAVACEISSRRGLLDDGVRDRLLTLLRRAGLPTRLHDLRQPPKPADVVEALDCIRRIRDGCLRFVLPVELGHTVIADDVCDDDVLEAIVATAGTDDA
jgi:3-dehydroquinate synthase